MQILLLSPYHGGSHRAWAEGYARHSQHTVAVLGLPARFWKWRMHGGAVTLARRWLAQRAAGKLPLPDLIVADDMLDLTTFLALTRRQTAHVPSVLYMHENQLTYPLPADPQQGAMRRQHGERDQHYAFINYASMLAADYIAFNSAYHLASWFDALPNFLRHFPEYNELGTVAQLRERAGVLSVGVDLAALAPAAPADAGDDQPPLIVWNQRWEYDKRPERFFAALERLMAEGIDFRVALCGERFSRQPTVFDTAAERLGARLIHNGYAERAQYRWLLHAADVTVSTAAHEFFGISIVEAIACATLPVLPDDLSYPELIPPQFHQAVLYADEDGLLARLRFALGQRPAARVLARQLADAMQRFDWRTLAPQYDALLAQVAAAKLVDVATKTVYDREHAGLRGVG